MSELYREQHPLLSDDLSDEAYSPHFHRRLRPFNYRGRARNNLKGAAAILTHWPDHWASFITYWWIGLGMICLMTFIIYNSLFSFPLIKIANSKPAGAAENHAVRSTTPLARIQHDVFMHLFIEEDAEVNLNEYIPYIEQISNKYNQFNYHLLVLYNDTKQIPFSAEENNEIALNSLWTTAKGPKKLLINQSNINIEYASLTSYMDNSPLKKYWKTLSPQLVEFLARANSVWNKGGITFNPNILTPRSSYKIYTDKLKKILHKFPLSRSENPFTEGETKYTTTSDLKNINTQRFNNIQDIINALENKDDSINAVSHETLDEAEDKEVIITKSEPRSFTATPNDDTSETKITTNPANYTQLHLKTVSLTENITKKIIADQKRRESTRYAGTSNSSSNPSLLPLFLKNLFHSIPSNETEATETLNTVHRRRKSVIRNYKNNLLYTHPGYQELKETYEPIIISAAAINKSNLDSKVIATLPENEKLVTAVANRLTIDLKGNIIATDTPCHAFLGTIFSNAIHHNEEETVSDFIIAELSVFCKGLLSSCVGIDLILL